MAALHDIDIKCNEDALQPLSPSSRNPNPIPLSRSELVRLVRGVLDVIGR